MKNLKKHFKENSLIYLVLVTCAIIIFIIYNVNKSPIIEESKPIDKSLFHLVTLEETLELFEKNGSYYLVMGVDDCQATKSYAEFLKFELVNMNFPVYYLDLNTISKDNIENYNKLVEKLNLSYSFQDKEGTFGEFIGNTPMTAIISNKKQIYGFIGSLNDKAIESLVSKYKLSEKEE